MILCGIDYSMTSPAICILNTETKEVKFFSLTGQKKALKNNTASNIFLTEYPIWSTDTNRYDQISNWAMQFIEQETPSLIAIEGYSMGSRAGLICNLAENCGLLKYKIEKSGRSFVTFAPTEIKKHYVGKGNAKKEDVIAKVEDDLKVDFASLLGISSSTGKPIDDIADSYAIVKTLEGKMNG